MTRFSLRLNNDLAPHQYREIAEVAESAGIDQLWISHDLRWHAAPTLVADLAARTNRLRLGIGLHNPYTVHPVELAMTASSLDDLSGGRFDLAVGAGAAGFLELVGIDRARPLSTMRDTLTGLRQLLHDEPVTVAGWDPDLRLARPAPDVGLWLGATGPRMRALGGELADGVLALAMPPESHRRIVEEVNLGADSRVLPTRVETPLCLWLSLARHSEKAEEALRQKLEIYGAELGADILNAAGLTAHDFRPMPDRLTPQMRSLAVVGDATGVLEQCRILLAGGIDHLSFGPPLGPDPVAATAHLANSVLPHLKD